MITGEHSVIRTAEQDDAAAMVRLYSPECPRAALLDRRRELLVPTTDEVRELLGRKDAQPAAFYAVEDVTGVVRGFCSIRGAQSEVLYGDFVVMFFAPDDYDAPLAEEVFAFLSERAFAQKKLNKVMAQCLDSEDALRGFLVSRGFGSQGIQRDMFYSAGKWHGLETFCLFSEKTV